MHYLGGIHGGIERGDACIEVNKKGGEGEGNGFNGRDSSEIVPVGWDSRKAGKLYPYSCKSITGRPLTGIYYRLIDFESGIYTWPGTIINLV